MRQNKTETLMAAMRTRRRPSSTQDARTDALGQIIAAAVDTAPSAIRQRARAFLGEREGIIVADHAPERAAAHRAR
jgi:hypothetical protein